MKTAGHPRLSPANLRALSAVGHRRGLDLDAMLNALVRDGLLREARYLGLSSRDLAGEVDREDESLRRLQALN